MTEKIGNEEAQKRLLIITGGTLVTWLLIHQSYRFIGHDGQRFFGAHDLATLERAMLLFFFMGELLMLLTATSAIRKLFVAVMVMAVVVSGLLSLLFLTESNPTDSNWLAREFAGITGCGLAAVLTRVNNKLIPYTIMAAALLYTLYQFLLIRSVDNAFVVPFLWT